jgi:glyoxylase-like metal-dependent hydrolase (beta-lactamase superfamily II)
VSDEFPQFPFPRPLLETRTVGRLTVHAIQAGGQQLDGGAMFGVVPKTLWSRRLAADDKNRIPMGMRCLLVEHEQGLVLFDTGSGNKETPKFHDIYGIQNRGAAGRTALEDGIRAAGFSPDDIALVVNTHLHFDHAGGNTWRTPSGEVLPTFPNARYVVQAGERAYAEHPNERTTASYFPANWAPVMERDRFDFVSGEREILPGITVRPTPGHTPHHQSVLVRSGGETLCFLGDVVPTAHHLPLPWIMGYDVEPLVTLESKRALLADAVREEWLLVFEHDAHVGFGRAVHDGKAYRLAE